MEDNEKVNYFEIFRLAQLRNEIKKLKQELANKKSPAIKEGIDIEYNRSNHITIDETFYKGLFDKMKERERTIVNTQETYKLKDEIGI